MKNRLLIIFLLISFLNANILELFKNKNYFEVCKFDNIQKYIENEDFLTIIGVSCVKSDKIICGSEIGLC